MTNTKKSTVTVICLANILAKLNINNNDVISNIVEIISTQDIVDDIKAIKGGIYADKELAEKAKGYQKYLNDILAVTDYKYNSDNIARVNSNTRCVRKSKDSVNSDIIKNDNLLKSLDDFITVINESIKSSFINSSKNIREYLTTIFPKKEVKYPQLQLDRFNRDHGWNWEVKLLNINFTFDDILNAVKKYSGNDTFTDVKGKYNTVINSLTEGKEGLPSFEEYVNNNSSNSDIESIKLVELYTSFLKSSNKVRKNALFELWKVLEVKPVITGATINVIFLSTVELNKKKSGYDKRIRFSNNYNNKRIDGALIMLLSDAINKESENK